MSRVRLPEAFFNEALTQDLKAIVGALVPLAQDVLICHADAPGWCLVDFNPASRTRPPDDRSPIGLFARRPLLEDHTPMTNATLGVTGTRTLDGMFWEWTPVAGLTIYGRLSDSREWDLLISRMLGIVPSIARLFGRQTPPG